ncbi:hypothetical protein RvY_09122 [Ramazzottius varieornatus]|uniref:UNC93-like protein MFSD11 n=1 Tax=Ramazzottius varieornatus TaxID=947166 RepID=A0A1D1V875_RAMVA|nr:hypothetical protein RvY_09122 [Ramazzottius varieornatus]
MPQATGDEDATDITGVKEEREVAVVQHTSRWSDLKYRNVILLGLSFMGLFSAFQTCGLVQTIVLQNYFGQDASTLGYVSLGILYATLGCANWFSPFLISLIGGPKIAMILGGITYSLFIAIFLRPYYATLYAGSVLVGVGAAVLWTAQGVFLTINSDKHTMARNSGLFWALFQSSYVPGNLFFFFYLNGETKIEDHTRTVLYTVLLAVSVMGIAVMFFFKHPVVAPVSEETLPVAGSSTEVQVKSARGNPFPAMVAAFRLWKGRDMVLLSFTFAYTGFAQTFFGGVYGTCLGYTAQFGEMRKSVVGLSGVAIGLGEILGKIKTVTSVVWSESEVWR